MKIKEVEKLVSMNSQTIRYYDKLGFLHPERDENGYRNYSMEDVKILKRIRFLRELDISLELIGVILENPDEFQSVLERYIQTLRVQVDNLEEIEKRCEQINKRNVPLLDAIVDGDFQDLPEVSNSKIKDVLQKTRTYLQPFSCITLGHKTTSFELFKRALLTLFVCVLPSSLFSVFLCNMTNGPFLVVFLSMLLLLWTVMFVGMFKEKFFEFRDKDFYVFNSYQQNKFKVIKSILKNNTVDCAHHYYYGDIHKVKLQVVKKYSAVNGWGAEKTFSILFIFEMNDGYTFIINSSFFKDNQYRKTVLAILDYHNVNIEDEQNVREALVQEEMSLYEYLDQNIK